MTGMILKRLSAMIVSFVGITLIGFLVIHLAPGSPVGAASDLNPKMSLQAAEKLKVLYYLDRPVLWQYRHWVMQIGSLDFGRSFIDGQSVTVKIAQAARVTLAINGLALIIIFAAGIYLGVLSARFRRTRLDRIILILSLVIFSIPSFWLALMMIAVFSVQLRLFPATGLTSLFYDQMSPARQWLDILWHMTLPVFIASLGGAAAVCRYMRVQMVEVMGQNYIRTAYAKGLPTERVLWDHAVKNALLPVITLFGLSVPALLGGSVILETVFSIPGMGRLFYNAVFSRDYPVVMGLLVIGALLTLVGNCLADFMYQAADPRIRPEGHS